MGLKQVIAEARKAKTKKNTDMTLGLDHLTPAKPAGNLN